MGFTTRASSKTVEPACNVHLRWLWLTLLLVIAPGSALAENFFITGVHIGLKDNVYLLNANIDYRLTPDVLEALNNGVPITLQVDIEIQRKRNWWFDADVASLQQRYQLQYHALSHQYLLSNINSGAFYSFHTLDSALDALGTLHDFPLLDKQLVQADEKYEVLLHAKLDIEALPSPLRPLAYITPAWRLDSDWYTWSLTP
jgi:hypothetical protein